jgi:hypothetical protein
MEKFPRNNRPTSIPTRFEIAKIANCSAKDVERWNRYENKLAV